MGKSHVVRETASHGGSKTGLDSDDGPDHVIDVGATDCALQLNAIENGRQNTRPASLCLPHRRVSSPRGHSRGKAQKSCLQEFCSMEGRTESNRTDFLVRRWSRCDGWILSRRNIRRSYRSCFWVRSSSLANLVRDLTAHTAKILP